MYPRSVKLLVTGGAGFIGSNFIELYSKKFPNNEILIIDKLKNLLPPYFNIT